MSPVPWTASVSSFRAAEFTFMNTLQADCVVDPPNGPAGENAVHVTCSPNLTNTDRRADLTISTGSGQPLVIPITQNPAPWRGVPLTINFSESGQTALYGINNNGRAIGEFYDSFGNIRAFTYDGSYTFLNAAGRVLVHDINNAGHVLGYDQNGYFLRIGNVSNTLVNYPGAHSTRYTGINDRNQFVGYFTDSNRHARGFIRTGNNFNNVVVISHPDATFTACDQDWTCGTVLTGINDSGQAVGYYIDAAGISRGFMYAGGVFTGIEHPDSANRLIKTHLTGINNGGHMTGYFWDEDGYVHGFVVDGGRFIEITHSGAASDGEGVFVLGINDAGRIAGWFDDGERARGFLLAR